MHDKSKKTYKHTLNLERFLRLYTVLTGTFQTATQIILRFDRDLPQKEKQSQMQLLILRAKYAGCKKYIICRKYAPGGELEAFYLFLDIDKQTGEKICKRWSCGPHEVTTVNPRDPAIVQSDLFTSNPAPRNKPIYEPCYGIWDKLTP